MTRLLVLVLAAYAGALGVLLHVDFDRRNVVLLFVATALFAIAVVLLVRSRRDPRTTVRLAVGGGSLFQVLALTRGPQSSDDAYRYAWDAKVQLAGIDPYRYVPQDSHLAALREAWVFGPSSPCTHVIPESCTAINRPSVPTIYPPVAQGIFDFGRLLSFGGHGGLFAFQLLAAIGAVAVGLVLARSLREAGRAVWPVALWMWCPVVVLGFGNDAHIDWAGVLLAVLALRARARGRPVWSGVLAGAAIATKLYPALILPALLRGRSWLVGATTVAVVIAVYVPHVLAVGIDVLGYLPGYLDEQGYRSGSRLLLLGEVFPHPVDLGVGVLVLAAVAVLVWYRAERLPRELAALVMTGAAFLVVTPAYGWYATLLVALAVLAGRPEWTCVALAPAFAYLLHDHTERVLAFAAASVATAVWWWLRSRAEGRRGTGQGSLHEQISEPVARPLPRKRQQRCAESPNMPEDSLPRPRWWSPRPPAAATARTVPNQSASSRP